jgi:hypothetical protein
LAKVGYIYDYILVIANFKKMTARLLILILFFPILLYGQNNSSDVRVAISEETDISSRPKMILVIDTLEIRLDSISIKQIKPEWIKAIEVVKEEKYKNLYGDGNGDIYIYPKDRFKKRILKQIGQK